ncbi:MAG: 4-hydroxy-tetrahydrodipicolinate synthase [Candidatus Omnitrophica bacterium]|nr:4-hydroxy-tetrahydrodipicolinate synthase [Candidatus Omnitrophota bacterium]
MLKGSIVALITPFNDDLTIDTEGVKELVNWHIDNATDAILVCGTTGESATLTHQEHRELIKLVINEVNGRVPVIAGCGSNSTQEAIGLVQYAKDTGADYALVITPYYNKPTQSGLYKHFKFIADNVDIPIILYNVPGRTGVNILPETVAKLYKDCTNIIGIKEASGSVDQAANLMSIVDDNFLLYSGCDEIVTPILSLGGVGVISVLANIMPKATHDMVFSYLEGQVSQSKKIQLELYKLIKYLFVETNPIPAKTALGLMKKIKSSSMRLPLCEMSSEGLDKFKAVLQEYKLIK